MVEKIIITVVLAFLNGMFYRMGGSGNYARFFRPLGIGVLTIATILVWTGFHLDWKFLLGVALSGGASAGLSTTYFKKKNHDARWWNWALVGLALSIALLPYAYVNSMWFGFSIRTAVLIPAISLWSQLIGWDVLEENGRGFLHIATIPLIFLWA